MAGGNCNATRIIALILLVIGIVGICGGIALREFAVLAVPFAGGGALIVVEAIHLFFTGRFH